MINFHKFRSLFHVTFLSYVLRYVSCCALLCYLLRFVSHVVLRFVVLRSVVLMVLSFPNATFGTLLQLICKVKEFLTLSLPCNELNNFLSRALLASFF